MLLRRRRPDLSVVVVTYRMQREAPRTLQSLSRAYQQSVDDLDYEVVVIDNGSPDPLALPDLDGDYRLHRIDPAPASPAYAANLGVSMTRGRYVALILDGARMVTPGVLGNGVAALRQHRRAIVTPMAWHLGPEHQSVSIPKGYGPTIEDELLERIGWPRDGYRLFDVSALAMANPQGFYGPVNESCCLMLSRRLWRQVGGLDERFDLPGGGLVSLDLFTRLVGQRRTQLVVLLGEGSFHQVHGGAASSPGVDHTPWHEQYERLRGGPYKRPDVSPAYHGSIGRHAQRWARATV